MAARRRPAFREVAKKAFARRIALILLILTFQHAGPARSGSDRVALVMGNSNYRYAPGIRNPANDAAAVAKALREIGFAVFEKTDLDRIGMEAALSNFANEAATAHIALIFYAGHGVQLDGKNFLIPIDARFDASSSPNSQVIDIDRVLAALSSRSRANIIILDACRDNPFAQKLAAVPGFSQPIGTARGLAPYAKTGKDGPGVGLGNLIAFATAPGQVALDGDNTPDSPFTTGLLKHIQTPGLEVRSMLARVRADVAAATGNQQIPWDNSSLLEDIYLAGTPPTERTAADEIAWSAIKDTTDLSALQEFVRQYPTSRRRPDAEKRIAAISPPPPSAVNSTSPAKGAPPGCFVFNGERYCH